MVDNRHGYRSGEFRVVVAGNRHGAQLAGDEHDSPRFDTRGCKEMGCWASTISSRGGRTTGCGHWHWAEVEQSSELRSGREDGNCWPKKARASSLKLHQPPRPPGPRGSPPLCCDAPPLVLTTSPPRISLDCPRLQHWGYAEAAQRRLTLRIILIISPRQQRNGIANDGAAMSAAPNKPVSHDDDSTH